MIFLPFSKLCRSFHLFQNKGKTAGPKKKKKKLIEVTDSEDSEDESGEEEEEVESEPEPLPKKHNLRSTPTKRGGRGRKR